jgi:cytoskeletal protein CcmA (bactofilin family)
MRGTLLATARRDVHDVHHKTARDFAKPGRNAAHGAADCVHAPKEKTMFNKDGLFSKKDDAPAPSQRPVGVNITPDLRGAVRANPQPAEETLQRAAVAQPPAQPREDELAGSKLIVGPDIKLKGVEITDCDTLVVEGRVEASMDSRVVQIAKEGIFNGTATMDVAEIWGSFEGTLTARKQLVVYATGRVSGTVRYGKIRVEEGGELSGDISTLSAGHAKKDNAYQPVKQQEKAKA